MAATKALGGLIDPDHSYLTTVPLNTTEIDQSLLNIEKKERSNLFPWTGQFSPQLIEVLLERYASQENIVLDPFAGSGTLLCECALRKLGALAVEINPSACCMARVYELTNCERSERLHFTWEVGHALREAISDTPPLFLTKDVESSATPLIERLASVQSSLTCTQSIGIFEALVVLLDLYRPGLEQKRVLSTWNRLVSCIQRLPYSDRALKVINADARRIPIGDHGIDLVITSPPYINVFNYHQQYRTSAEFLGWDLLNVAKSEIGANRKHRANRFLTVIQYCLDIAEVLAEMRRVCKESARMIFIVGRQSKVRSVVFLNSEIVARLATQCAGYDLCLRQERVFKNKFGEHIFEDILHFGIQSNPDGGISPRAIALEILERALRTAPTDVAHDVEDAICQIDAVKPSPIFAGARGNCSPVRRVN